jgi:hypothetical protein
MAEVVSIVASGIAVSQLASSIVASTHKLYEFCRDLKGAPRKVGHALKEVELLGKFIKGMNVEGNAEVLQEALAFCAEVVEEFESLLSNLKQGLDKKAGRDKGRRTR